LDEMKTLEVTENFTPVFFVTKVTKPWADRGLKPYELTPRPFVFQDCDRLRGMTLVRFAARRTSRVMNWL
jgi:hypothetical protein